jgi:asparagine synthase (glutamine-hydrolysing)
MLQAKVLDSPSHTVIINRERYADEASGLELERNLSDAAVLEAREIVAAHLLDYAILSLHKPTRTLSYSASASPSAPVYFFSDAGTVSFDWDYARLLRGRDAIEISRQIALAQISGMSTYGPQTVVKGMVRSTAGSTLTATTRGMEVTLPAAVGHDGVYDVAPDARIAEQFIDALAAILEARPCDRHRTAVELSGGMDSALTSLVSAASLGGGLVSLGAQFGGAMGDAQRDRRLALQRAGRFEDISIPAERFAPFAPTSMRRERFGVSPEDENYPEIFEAAFPLLQAAGIDTLISGLGGDELYVTYSGEDAASPRHASERPAFLTEAGTVAAKTAQSRYPAGLLQETCWSGAASQTQRVLRYGLWPVHPYHTPAIAQFVARLPRPYRRDRQLLRDALALQLEENPFAGDYLKETFRPVLERGLNDHRSYLIELWNRSPIARWPEIRRDEVAVALEKDARDMSAASINAVFNLFKVLCFFQ